MGIFRDNAIGFVMAAGALLVANTSDAKVPVATLILAHEPRVFCSHALLRC
jgi:hypothetical protein